MEEVEEEEVGGPRLHLRLCWVQPAQVEVGSPQMAEGGEAG